MKKQKCPYCKGSEFAKDGLVKGKQRYLCKNCGKRITVFKKKGKPQFLKRRAIQLYLEGLSLRAIGRFLNVSAVSVMTWVKKFADELPEPVIPEKVSVVEIDEMWHWLEQKKRNCGSGLQFVVLQGECSPMNWVIVEHKQEKDSGKS